MFEVKNVALFQNYVGSWKMYSRAWAYWRVNFMVTFVFFSLAKNFQQSYIESGGTSSSFCNKVFASWDYCICDENMAKVKSQNIVQTVKVCAF